MEAVAPAANSERGAAAAGPGPGPGGSTTAGPGSDPGPGPAGSSSGSSRRGPISASVPTPAAPAAACSTRDDGVPEDDKPGGRGLGRCLQQQGPGLGQQAPSSGEEFGFQAAFSEDERDEEEGGGRQDEYGELAGCPPACLGCLPAWGAYRPTCLPACLSAYLPACLPVCLSACLPVCLSACLPACLPACPTCLPACLPAVHTCLLIFLSPAASWHSSIACATPPSNHPMHQNMPCIRTLHPPHASEPPPTPCIRTLHPPHASEHATPFPVPCFCSLTVFGFEGYNLPNRVGGPVYKNPTQDA